MQPSLKSRFETELAGNGKGWLLLIWLGSSYLLLSIHPYPYSGFDFFTWLMLGGVGGLLYYRLRADRVLRFGRWKK